MYQCKGLCCAFVSGVVCAVQSEYCFVVGGACDRLFDCGCFPWYVVDWKCPFEE